MKTKNIKFFKYSLILFIILLISGCKENPLTEISVFSGRWKIVMSDNSSIAVREANILINDFGDFSNKILIYPLNDTSLIIRGSLNIYGDIVARFYDRSGGNPSGMITGNILEVTGLTFGSGYWNDTLRTPNAAGKWVARRN